MSRAPTSFVVPPAFQAWQSLRRPIWLYDPQGRKGVYANPAALRLWGAANLDELLSRDFSQLSPAVQTRIERLAQSTAGGEALSERWTFYPNGAPVTVQAIISTYALPDGRPVLLFEAAETEVEAGERRAVEALRHTSTLITLFDADGRAIFANPAAFAAYGVSEHPFIDRFADPERGRAMMAQALAGETRAEVCEIVTSAGRCWHHLDARPVLDPVTGAAGLLLTERDVTRRVEAELARAAAEQKAAMAEARQRFLSDMSHELRTPLNSVIGFSELLRDAVPTEEATAHAARIHANGKRVLEVVNAMIRLSELDGWNGEVVDVAANDAEIGAETPAGPAAARPLRVLCVDDNESNRALVVAILTAQGIECQTANDGAEAVEAADGGDWDLILMDIQMPVMDGVAASRAIRALAGPASAVPIIAVTANTLAEQVSAYAEAGMVDCLAKPIDMAELITKVAVWSAADGRAASRPCDAGTLDPDRRLA